MIADTSKVTMPDGATVPVIDLFPGRSIVSPKSQNGIAWRLSAIPIRDRRIEMKGEVHRIILSNGESLTATADQRVATVGRKSLSFRRVGAIKLGDLVIGECSGVRVSMTVAATERSTDPVRCVSLETGGKPYIAEGVVCR